MSHPGDANELLEVASQELRPIVRDDARPCCRVLLSTTLDDGFDVGLFHRFADFPMNDGPTETIEHRTQVVEGPADVEVGDVDVPVLVGADWLLESDTFATGPHIPAVE